MNEFNSKRIMVTGGTGLIGRQVVDLMVKEGAILTVACLDDLDFHSHVQYLRADLTDMSIARKAVKGQDYIFHLAGVKASPKITIDRGDLMTKKTLQVGLTVTRAAFDEGIMHLLFTSSIGAYHEAKLLTEANAFKGKPMDAPGLAKRRVEKQIRKYELLEGRHYKVVRLTNCFGLGDNFDPATAMFIPSLMAKVLRGDDPVELWGDGSQVRDFIYSKDAARGILHMMLHAPDSMPVNLGTGIGYTVADVVKELQSIVPFNVKYDTTKPTGVARRVLDTEKAKGLGFEAHYSLADGLEETWEWFKSNPTEYTRRLNYFNA